MQIFVFPEVNYRLIFFHTLNFLCTIYPLGFPGGSDGKEPANNVRDRGSIPWVGKIPRRRAWQPTPVSLPGKSHGQRSLAGYSPWSCRVRQNWATNTHTWTTSPPMLESDKTEKLIPTKSHASGKHACLVLLFVFPVEISCLELPPICTWTGWLFGIGIAVLPRVPFNFSENVFVFFCAIYIVS